MIIINDYWILNKDKKFIEISSTENLILKYFSIYNVGTAKQIRDYVHKEMSVSTIRTSIFRLNHKLKDDFTINNRFKFGYNIPENENIFFIYTVNMNGEKNENKKR